MFDLDINAVGEQLRRAKNYYLKRFPL